MLTPSRQFRTPAFMLGLIYTVLSCTPSKPNALLHSKPFQFNPQETIELTIAKSDPHTDDRWITTLTRVQIHDQGRVENDWKISSAPDSVALIDREANEIWINHLLDVLQTLRIESLVSTPEKPHGSLSSFGLDPPRFALRWKSTHQNFEFRSGNTSKDGMLTYFTLDGKTVYAASGAAFKLLPLIQSFHFLRKTKWSHMNLDDIDELRLFRKGKLILYAQREGNQWTELKHQPLKKNVDTFLSQTLTAPLNGFLDDWKETSSLLQKLKTSPSLFEAQVSDRQGRTTSFKVALQNEKIYGLTSIRPSSLLILNPEIVKTFEKFIQ